ncbi:hypothetical protein ABTL46_21385, partial [Acinetobacter baumannii]
MLSPEIWAARQTFHALLDSSNNAKTQPVLMVTGLHAHRAGLDADDHWNTHRWRYMVPEAC